MSKKTEERQPPKSSQAAAALTEEELIQSGIDADPDTFEPTDEQWAEFRPASEVALEIVEAYRRTRGPQKNPTKELISIRLDPDVLEHFRETGPGWQGRINDVLRRAAFDGG